MFRARNRRGIVIGSLLGLLLLITVGYAAFQTQLEIKGSSKITSKWDIKITNVTSGTATGSAENVSTPTWTDLTAYMEANLYEQGDAMDYDVTISNRGTFDAKLEDVIGTPSNSEAVLITFSGYIKGEKLLKGQDKIIHVKIQYNPEYAGGETSGTSTIQFNYTQGEGSNIPQVDSYLLTYNYEENGGTSSNAQTEYLNSGTVVDLSTKVATKQGYTFVGWNTDKDAHMGLSTLSIGRDTTLYAIFSKQLIVTYDDVTQDNCTIYNNVTSCSVTLPNKQREDYILEGWFAERELINKVGSYGDNYSLTNNISLYSKFIYIIPTCVPTVTSATIDTVSISSNCENSDDITEYSYSINNGTPTSSQNSDHTFNNFDLSTIEITVTNKYGVTRTFTISEANLQLGYEIIYQALENEYDSVNSNKNTYNSEFLNKTYPIGSIYISTSSTNPGSILGGTWEAYAQGRTLIGMGNNGTNNYTSVGATGGVETVTLATTNLPAHTHTVTPTGTVTSTFTGTKDMTTSTSGAHTHTFPYVTTKEAGEKSISDGMQMTDGGFTNRVQVSGGTTTTNSTGAHTHSYKAAGTVTSTFTGTSNIATSSVGSNTSFNIMNPYIVTYIWRRTA